MSSIFYLGQEGLTGDIIANYARLAKSKAHVASIAVNELVAEMLLLEVINDLMF